MINGKRYSALAAIAGLWLASGAAKAQTAEDLIQKFDSVCLATRGDRAAALRAMDAAGWMVAPQHVIDQLGQGMSNVEARLYSARNVVYVGMVADAPLDEPTSMCSMGMAPGIADLAGPLRAWSGVEPLISGDNGDVSFAFSEVDGSRRAIADRAEAERLSREGDILIVSARTTPQLSHIVSMRQRDLVW